MGYALIKYWLSISVFRDCSSALNMGSTLLVKHQLSVLCACSSALHTWSALIVAILMVLPSTLSDKSSVSCKILCLSFPPLFYVMQPVSVSKVSVTLFFFRFFALDDDGSIVGVLHLTIAMVRPWCWWEVTIITGYGRLLLSTILNLNLIGSAKFQNGGRTDGQTDGRRYTMDMTKILAISTSWQVMMK
jgi:hypothetical protein